MMPDNVKHITTIVSFFSETEVIGCAHGVYDVATGAKVNEMSLGLQLGTWRDRSMALDSIVGG